MLISKHLSGPLLYYICLPLSKLAVVVAGSYIRLRELVGDSIFDLTQAKRGGPVIGARAQLTRWPITKRAPNLYTAVNQNSISQNSISQNSISQNSIPAYIASIVAASLSLSSP
jgi:hypothetical protein